MSQFQDFQAEPFYFSTKGRLFMSNLMPQKVQPHVEWK